jgi:hypothetical protein
VADVSPGIEVDRILFGSLALRLAAEWPWRLVVPPVARSLPSRISTVEVLGAAGLYSWTTALGAVGLAPA